MTRLEIPEEEAGRNPRRRGGLLIFEEERVSRPTRGSHANSFPLQRKFAIRSISISAASARYQDSPAYSRQVEDASKMAHFFLWDGIF